MENNYFPFRKSEIFVMVNIKPLLFGMSLGVLLFASLFANIVLHEMGHFMVAEQAGLSPQMHFFEPYGGGSVSLFTPNFFTTYTSTSSNLADLKITLAGPLVNLAITVGLLAVYFAIPKEKRTYRLQLIFAVLIVPSIISFIANIVPFGFNDGTLILGYLG